MACGTKSDAAAGSARREEREYRAVFNRRATTRAGMQRRSTATAFRNRTTRALAKKAAPNYRLRVPHDVADLLRGLHPSLKHKIKWAIQAIQHDPYSGKLLREELTGLRNYRVSRFRVVYRIAADNIVEIVAVGPRKNIYEETLRPLQRKLP